MNDLEEKRAAANYELVWARLSKMSFRSLKEAHFFSYMQGWGARGLVELERRQTTLSEEHNERNEAHLRNPI